VAANVLKHEVQESLPKILISLLEHLPEKDAYDGAEVTLEDWLDRSFMSFVGGILQKEVELVDFNPANEPLKIVLSEGESCAEGLCSGPLDAILLPSSTNLGLLIRSMDCYLNSALHVKVADSFRM
jgi:hypothetical protein